jgi:hypothetical protein
MGSAPTAARGVAAPSVFLGVESVAAKAREADSSAIISRVAKRVALRPVIMISKGGPIYAGYARELKIGSRKNYLIPAAAFTWFSISTSSPGL